MSVLLSQFVPPSPSLSGSTGPFSTWNTFLLTCFPHYFLAFPEDHTLDKSHTLSLLLETEPKTHIIPLSYLFTLCGCASTCTLLCLTLCDPMDYSPPGSSVHGIFQTRILELPFPSPGESSQLRNQAWDSCISCIDRQILYQQSHWESLIIFWIYPVDLFVCLFPVLFSHCKFCERRRSMSNAIQAQNSAWWIMGAQKYYMRKWKIEQMSPCKADSLSCVTD